MIDTNEKVLAVVCTAQGGVTLTAMVSYAMPQHREDPLKLAQFYQTILHAV